jgi:fructose-bisphosphate aldolase, class I
MAKFDVDRKQLVVAMDHGRAMGAVAGLEDPGRVIETVVEAGADAIMTSFGVIKRYRDRLIGRKLSPGRSAAPALRDRRLR